VDLLNRRIRPKHSIEKREFWSIPIDKFDAFHAAKPNGGTVGGALHAEANRPDCTGAQLRLWSALICHLAGVTKMSLGTILLIVLVLLLLGALPTWPYSGGWGYYPSGGLGLVLIVLLVLVVSGRL